VAVLDLDLAVLVVGNLPDFPGHDLFRHTTTSFNVLTVGLLELRSVTSVLIRFLTDELLAMRDFQLGNFLD
jgi:hypothetical protein